MKLVNIGSGNMIAAERVVSILTPESAPIKRIIQDAKEQGVLIDATMGRKTKTVIITDSHHIILCYLSYERLASRISDCDVIFEEEEDD